jgi:hypothetical protein
MRPVLHGDTFEGSARRANSGPSVFLSCCHLSLYATAATSRNPSRSPAYDQIARPRFAEIVSRLGTPTTVIAVSKRRIYSFC